VFPFVHEVNNVPYHTPHTTHHTPHSPTTMMFFPSTQIKPPWTKPSESMSQNKSCFPSSVVLLRVSIAVIKQHDHKQLGEKRVYFSLQL
jgi:hypothetical protein